MKLVKLSNPYYPVRKNLVDELFDSFLYNDTHANYCAKPATNITENENDFRLELLVPGFKKEEVKLSLEKDLLTVKGEKVNNSESGNSEPNYLRREFSAANFEKQFTLPETVDTDNITAKFENGILEIALPKRQVEPEKEAKEISIL